MLEFALGRSPWMSYRVVSLAAMPKRPSSLSLTRPPAACPKSRTSSPRRRVRRAKAAAPVSCSTKVFCVHSSLRHRQRPIRSWTVTAAPCSGKSCKRRTCQLCLNVDCLAHLGQYRVPIPCADTSQRPLRNSTLCTSIPGPKANFAFFSMPYKATELYLSKSEHGN